MCAGINNVNDDCKIKVENEMLGPPLHQRKFASNVLYTPLDKLKDVLSVVDKNGMNGINVMNVILCILTRLIDTKMIISDEIMILCWTYYNSIDTNKNKISISKKEFLDQHLLKCVSDCLSDEPRITNSFTSVKTRSYMYFKEYLLHSNIWYCKDNKEDKLLFEYVNDLVDKLLKKQKDCLQNGIELHEEKEHCEKWKELCEFKEYSNKTQFRQDSIENGIKPVKSIANAYVTATKIDNPSFNVLSEFNDKMYLTQCLTFANENNDYFQSEMKKLFDGKGKFQEAPVKTYDRCLVKSS